VAERNCVAPGNGAGHVDALLAKSGQFKLRVLVTVFIAGGAGGLREFSRHLIDQGAGARVTSPPENRERLEFDRKPVLRQGERTSASKDFFEHAHGGLPNSG
jgi:hypothetical protein